MRVLRSYLIIASLFVACGPGSEASPAVPRAVEGHWTASGLEPFTADRVVALASDRPVVTALWATWCTPCIEEMPELEAFQRAHPDVVVLGLATDTTAKAAIQAVFDKVRPSYAQGLLAGGEGPFLARLGLEWDGVLPKTVVTRGGISVLLRPPVTRASLEAALEVPP